MSAPTQPRDTAPRPMQGWDPFRELADLHERLDRLVDPGGAAAPTWAPPVDVIETDDAWVVEAELPGIDRKDITIELRDNELSISGEIKERKREGILRRKTRRVGEFDVRVTLPGHVNAEDVQATMEEGVLTVRVPKPATARPHRIEVK